VNVQQILRSVWRKRRMVLYWVPRDGALVRVVMSVSSPFYRGPLATWKLTGKGKLICIMTLLTVIAQLLFRIYDKKTHQIMQFFQDLVLTSMFCFPISSFCNIIIVFPTFYHHKRPFSAYVKCIVKGPTIATKSSE